MPAAIPSYLGAIRHGFVADMSHGLVPAESPQGCIDNDMTTPEGNVILRHIRRDRIGGMGGQV
jgi:hypothetical protein